MNPKIVIKLGGASLDDAKTLQQLSLLIQFYQNQNQQVILVHDGGPAINRELSARNIKWSFIRGQRQTSPEMMVVIEDVLARHVNSIIVESLKKFGIPAEGLSGASFQTLLCSTQDPELMCVGKIESVNTESLEQILQNGRVPVIAPIGVGANGEKFNINADWAASRIAVALKAEQLLFLTDQNGVLDQNKNLIPVLTPQQATGLIDSEVIIGGMMTKVRTIIGAQQQGVKQLRILNAGAVSSYLAGDYLGTVFISESSEVSDLVKETNLSLKENQYE